MNGKNALAIVEADDVVDPGAIEQVPAKRRGSSVGQRAARKHQTDSTAASRELHRSFDEELVSIDMRACLDAIDAGLAHEIGQAPCLVSTRAARRRIAA